MFHPSVYASYQYVSAAKILEGNNASAELALSQIDNYFLYHPYIKRPISHDSKAKDIISAYDFGGFWFNTDNPAIITALISTFNSQFCDYCFSENIVTEFIRFYPFARLHNLHSIYDISKAADNVVLHLNKEYGEIWNDYTSSLRKALRKARRCDLKILRTEDLKAFLDLYYANLDILKAHPKYYFPFEFLKKIQNHLTIIEAHDKNREICASHTYLNDNGILFAFLCHGRREKQQLRPNDFVYDFAIRQLCRNKMIMHFGGGRSGLVKYKKKFSKDTIPYYVGTKVYNNTLYETLNSDRFKDNRDVLDSAFFFPKYRYVSQ